MAVMGILFPAVLHYTHSEVHVGKSELSLSRFSSCIMLVAYVAYLFFQLKSQRNLYVSVNEGASMAWEIPVAFISVILLPLVGNATEHASAIMFAMKDKLDISLGVAIGSSTQISMFVEGTANYFKGLMLILCYLIVATNFYVHPAGWLFYLLMIGTHIYLAAGRSLATSSFDGLCCL
eukprot:XP_014631075.1 vacuolar cation/proton exchanger 2 isoform X4 [Glycine max]